MVCAKSQIGWTGRIDLYLRVVEGGEESEGLHWLQLVPQVALAFIM
jgi:hypothetical protein